MLMGLKPIGTMAHGEYCHLLCAVRLLNDLPLEFIMAIGALEGYVGANARAMDLWETARHVPLSLVAKSLINASTGLYSSETRHRFDRHLHPRAIL